MQEWTEQDMKAVLKENGTFCLFVHTPMCGTCQVSSKMLTVVLEMVPQLSVGKMNINLNPSIAMQYEIKSVPCLLMFKEGRLQDKIYAFQSVPYLLDWIKRRC